MISHQSGLDYLLYDFEYKDSQWVLTSHWFAFRRTFLSSLTTQTNVTDLRLASLTLLLKPTHSGILSQTNVRWLVKVNPILWMRGCLQEKKNYYIDYNSRGKLQIKIDNNNCDY